MSILSLKDMRAIAVALGGARQILTSHQGAAVVVAGEARTFNASAELANIDAALRLVGAAPALSDSLPQRSP